MKDTQKAMTEEKKKVITILRSLIISSPQRGKSLKELVRDYVECTASKIPTFEYRGVEDFLRSSGEFIIENFRGELIIYEKPNSDSWHISQLVQEQNKPKKRAPISNRFRQSVRPPNLPPQRAAYSNNNNFRSPTKSIYPKRYNNVSNNHQNGLLNQGKQTATMEFSFDQLKAQQTVNNLGQNRSVNGNSSRMSNSVTNERNQQNQPIQRDQNVDLRNLINQKREIKPTEFVDLTLSDSDSTTSRNGVSINQHNNQYNNQDQKLRPITAKRNDGYGSYQPQKDIQPIQQKDTQPIIKSVSPNIPSNVQQLLPNNPFFDICKPPPNVQQPPPNVQQPPPNVQQPPPNVHQPPPNVQQPPPNVQLSRMQDRLKNPPKYDTHAMLNKNVGVNNERKSMNERLANVRLALSDVTKQTSELNMKPTPPESPVTQSASAFQLDEKDLLDYCKQNGLSVPIFKIFKVNNRFQCHVTIDNVRYSSYPTDYGNQQEARVETAKYALDRLVSTRDQFKYEICLDNEIDLATKIYECIKDFPTGIFSKKIPEIFLSSYEQMLPSDWMNILAKHPKCFTIEDCINDQIVYVVEAPELDLKMEKLKLPWEKEYWYLNVTCTISTAEVWGRLHGEAYSNQLDSLVTDIELELMKEKQIPKSFNVGQIYVVLVNECAYRVRVEKVDDSRRQCFCFFIDEGDLRWYDMNEMYICQNKFLKLAPQAIRFALHGLEEFDENDFAKKHLEDVLLNPRITFVGQIFTKKEDYIAQEESDDLEAIVQVVMYDTSTDDDINLHPIIVERICADIPPPELVHSTLTPVIVSHISDNGDVFCQLLKNGLHYVNKLIHKLTQPEAHDRSQTLATPNSTNKTLFLIFDEEAHRWCRGKLISEGKQGNTMFLVDYGKTKVVPLSKIYRIESLNQALLTFPPQAIQVKLYGFPEFPENLVSTLRGYFSGDAVAYVTKMQHTGIIPEVSLYFAKDSCIVCVNDCIKLELERHQTETLLSRQNSTSSSSFSRQTSTTSNGGVQDELTNFSNMSIMRQLPKFQPPEVNSYFDVEVVMTATPSNFQIRPIKYMPQWVQQMKKLQEYCKENRDVIQLNMIREGEAYACLHSDGSWYRAIVEQRHRDAKIFVFFCDIGDINSIDDITKLKILPEEYRLLPKLAITAKLYGIRPVNGDWEMDDIIEFNRLVSRKKFQAIVGKIINREKPEDNAVLEIQLIDVSKDKDENINENFVRNGRAISYFAP